MGSSVVTAAKPILLASGAEARTIAIGRRLGTLLQPGDVVALRGELGAGKTRLVRGIVEGLGHDPSAVSSPTFVVANEYDDPYARLPAAHLDAYRLTGDEELANAGWDQLLDGVTVLLIEWPQRIQDALPESRWEINIEHGSPTERAITITPPPDRDTILLEALNRPATCRICGTPVAVDASTFPFCSARCRTIDLGKWVTGDYKITREVKDSDLETTD